MWTFPVHQEQREIAVLQLGKEHFLKTTFLPYFFLPFLPCLLFHCCFNKMCLICCSLIYKLICLSSESENGKMVTHHRRALWNALETSICLNTRCSGNNSLLLPVATPHYNCFFLIWLFTCRFVSLLLPNVAFTWGLVNFYGCFVQLALNAWW